MVSESMIQSQYFEDFEFNQQNTCDICGERIGLLGNRKLEDGNMCKECVKKLSPFSSDRRSSSITEIKEQLAYFGKLE